MKDRLLAGVYLLALIVLMSVPSFAAPADESALSYGSELFPGAYALGDGDSKPQTITADAALRASFYQAVNLLYAGNFGGAGKALDELKSMAYSQGYANLPDYSITLLSQAKTASQAGRNEEVSFLVFHAVELSPRDPRVQLMAASFYRELGLGAALGYLVSVLQSIWSYPLFFASFLANILLVTLIAATSAILLTCLIQLVRGGEALFFKLSTLAPRSLRGFFAPPALILVLVGPLFMGILGAVGCWSLVLSRLKNGCRWLGAAAGSLILAWGLAISVLGTVGFNVDLRANRVLEDVRNFSFTPKGEEFIKEQLAVSPQDPLLLTALGQVLQMQGLHGEAQRAYETVLQTAPLKSGLRTASRLNLAAIAHRNQEYQLAKEMLEKLEQDRVRSFELYYNLALAHLALLDTAKHREYYTLAKDTDEARLAALDERSESGGREPIASGVPISFFLPLLNRPVAQSSEVYSRRMVEKQNTLAASLLTRGSQPALLIWGAVVMLLGIGALRPKRAVVDTQPAFIQNERAESALWLFLPAGLMMAGERPLHGVGSLTVFLALVLFALEAPMKLYGALPLDISFKPFLVGAAAIVFVLSAILSVGLRRQAEAA